MRRRSEGWRREEVVAIGDRTVAGSDGLIEQWETEGGTQEAFCEARGVAVASFRWWKWKLGVEGVVGAGSQDASEGRVAERQMGALPGARSQANLLTHS
jgi:hypothetical protein